jgi:anti-sigma-K factor RskA
VTESLHALSGAYVVDALDDDEREIFEAHLPGCLDCQREVTSLREATALLADDAAMTPPESLRGSVLSGIKTIRPLAPETGNSVAQPSPVPAEEEREAASVAQVLPMRPRRRRIATLVAAAAAVVAVAAGAVYQPWQDNDPSGTTLSATDQVLNAPDTQKVSMSFKDGSRATVYRSKSVGRAVLLTQDMALPPPGRAYQVWLQDKAGSMIPAGMMKPQGDNKMLLKGDAAKATGVGITVEPESGSAAPTSEPIALFELGRTNA